MVIQDIIQLKQFLLWAKENGIVSIKVDNLEAQFGPGNSLPKEAQGMINQYWKTVGDPKANEMSLENPLLFDAGR